MKGAALWATIIIPAVIVSAYIAYSIWNSSNYNGPPISTQLGIVEDDSEGVRGIRLVAEITPETTFTTVWFEWGSDPENLTQETRHESIPSLGVESVSYVATVPADRLEGMAAFYYRPVVSRSDSENTSGRIFRGGVSKIYLPK